MRRTALTGALFLVLVAAAMAAAANSPESTSRYVSGAMDGRFTFAGPFEGPWTTTGDVKGTLRHLGLATMYTEHTASGDGTLSGGVFAIVAADGSEIRGSYTATGEWISGSQVLGTAEFVIEEGTGRFADATGGFTAAFLETFDDPSWETAGVSWTLKGTVDY